MKIIHKLNMDLTRCSCTPIVSAVQGEGNTRTLIISLFDNSVAWNIPNDVTAALSFKKPDGLCGLYDKLPNGDTATSIDGSVVTVTLAPQVLTVPGEVTASVVFFDKDMDRLATFPFRIRVAVDPAGGQHVSNEYYNYTTMAEVNEAVSAALADADEALNLAQATAIVCEATGQVVSVANSSNARLQGLTLYGKTTQNGTPTPENPVELVSAGASGAINTMVGGKNLFKPRETAFTKSGVTFTYNGDGTFTIKGTNTATDTSTLYNALASVVPLIDGEYYALNCEVISGSYSGINGTYCHYRSEAGEIQYNYMTVGTAPAIRKVKAGSLRNADIVINPSATVDCTLRFQLELGNKVTDYEPYKEAQTLTASTPNGLHGIDDSVKDEIDFARGVHVKRVHQETMAISAMSKTTNTVCTRYQYETEYPSKGGITNLCSVMKQTKYVYAASDTEHWYVDRAFNIFVLNEDVAAFEANENVTVLYDLKTPIETPLSAEELTAYAALHTNKPNTTVYNDAGAGMAVEYVADTKNYFDQKLAAISAALLNA